jgi:hypothetical protein
MATTTTTMTPMETVAVAATALVTAQRVAVHK